MMCKYSAAYPSSMQRGQGKRGFLTPLISSSLKPAHRFSGILRNTGTTASVIATTEVVLCLYIPGYSCCAVPANGLDDILHDTHNRIVCYVVRAYIGQLYDLQ